MPVPMPPPPVDHDAERARVKQLASYFGSLGIVPESSGNTQCDPVPGTPSLAHDATLTALAQLGPLRLQCDRSFVSLIDRSHQYIIAEATRSVSYHDAAFQATDPLYLGVVALDISWGVCPNTIYVFTDPTGQSAIRTPNVQADRSKYRIRNFLDDPDYVDRPYVRAWPHMRSYLEVPLRTSTGIVIGSYCVVDSRPRDDFDDGAVAVLSEIARTIMDHIEHVKLQEKHERLERLVRGLTLYVEENKSMQKFCEGDAAAGDRPLPVAPVDNPDDYYSTFASPSEQPPYSSGEVSSDTTLTTPSPNPQPDPFDAESTRASVGNQSPRPVLPPPGVRRPSPQRSRSRPGAVPVAFSRAANLIREATDIEGIVFLDASPSGFGSRRNQKRSNRASRRASADVSHDQDPLELGDSSPDCETLGLSVGAETAPSSNGFSVPEALLQRLLHKHPRGNIFFADDADQDMEAPLLFQVFSSARAIVFVPLWDYQKEGWYAAAIGWSNKSSRVFASEDLIYISAFGNSIMTEVSRIEATTVSRAKSDFISSISHELRSPLHGILASADLLKQTDLDAEQAALAEMIEICGTTLLDTMDHLLDYAKINHLTRTGRRRSSARGSKAGRKKKDCIGLMRTVDLSVLVQEVVEGAHLGHSAQTGRDLDNAGTQLHRRHKSAGDALSEPNAVIVTMDIENRSDWHVHSEPGAWRRIVLNLVGNALKYTARGSIEVTLRTEPVSALSDDAGPSARQICFSVKDTGRGMSAEYQKYRLFTPYAQEDSLVSGTGLGLSIVKNLVAHLGGAIEVDSVVGVGTHVRVVIPMPPAGAPTPPAHPEQKPGEELLQSLRGMTATSWEDPARRHACKHSEVLVSNFLRTVQEWCGMKVVTAAAAGGDTDDAPAPAADFCVVHISQLQGAHDRGLRFAKSKVIALCSSPPTPEQILTAAAFNATLLQQPFGPRKLRSALFAAVARRTRLPDPVDTEVKTPEGERPAELPFRLDSPAVLVGAPATVIASNPSSRPASSRAPASNESTLSSVSSSSSSSSAAAAAAQRQQQPQKRGLHLLLVDDNEINLRILTNYAQKLGCTWATAANGLQAVEAFKSAARPFDYILMDVSMPVMNGFEATREIRTHEAECGKVDDGTGGAGGRPPSSSSSLSPPPPHTKIVALTGLGSAESQEEAFASGMDTFLIKPVPLKRLRDVLLGGGNDDAKQ